MKISIEIDPEVYKTQKVTEIRNVIKIVEEKYGDSGYRQKLIDQLKDLEEYVLSNNVKNVLNKVEEFIKNV